MTKDLKQYSEYRIFIFLFFILISLSFIDLILTYFGIKSGYNESSPLIHFIHNTIYSTSIYSGTTYSIINTLFLTFLIIIEINLILLYIYLDKLLIRFPKSKNNFTIIYIFYFFMLIFLYIIVIFNNVKVLFL